ncbi:Histone-lysine N-methyltransferase PR-Set7 [Pseudolycoriella hygida]|uniref:[histone H4]-lysine(20) N-methyltransferase n=1 Tax=Pseudolycoriella hygida TaxID=35572 RepID=A0A9Q0RWV1_9DIPT|nr:Histone-lysine N-methyltransferase PR-Set7 [Pseudolycoriella hygida]
MNSSKDCAHLQERLRIQVITFSDLQHQYKNQCYEGIFNNSNSLKETWSNINKILGKVGSSQDKISLVEGGDDLVEHSKVAERFNCYFSDIGRRTRAAALSTDRKGDEQFESPKRKDCKLSAKSDNSIENRARAKPVPITNYFQVRQSTTDIHYVSDMDENACDSFDNPTSNNESNIFLQAPVLHLDIDKSPNQPSSIVINKSIPIKSNFAAITNSSLVTFSTVTINNAITSQQVKNLVESDSSVSSDSNSCDSGVVADKPLVSSPSKRQKPATPHRIVCPSPAKHPVMERSPTSELSNLNIGTKTHPKSKRRLNVNQADNFTNNSNESDRTFGAKKSSIKASNKSMNSLTDSSAKNTKMTDFYPVRRSVRKTKKLVEQEYLRSIETAISTGQETGLVIKEFPFKGRGIVASKPFQKGEFVVEYIGDLIKASEATVREKMYTKENAGCYMYYFKYQDQQLCIDATAESGKLGRLLNHSRNGNLTTKTIFYRNRPHLVLIAKEDIQIGDELTYDYGDRSRTALLYHPWLAL